ncbi:aminoacyl-tRNA hydrolase [Sinomonas cellulolyticus]|uniref:Aminoacyl-tRNA hydrolase n=1 Tax=Sinomonas cellulolyticus TaxID=2801916 RepID=A0ABS1K1M7_9MICC|nr:MULTISPECIES: alternative ribosome rescue aminoacyl-tRNA hydrolase ArfB [Sinomonas]MBL0705574.1 aminoacyl-tRNA hydrolase [Sinomonas cellulolyticus]GHG51405.1 aminoacyl-tRNA hydrolase [Sinomonas sp. KCTC 49339]
MDIRGRDLRIPPQPGARHGIVIPAAELVERFSRSGGPGGQGVNTTDSRVELLFDPGASAAFSQTQRERILARLSGRLVGGRVSIVASGERSQLRNREDARERLVGLLSEAILPPGPARRPTRPTRGSQLRRLESKKRRADIKSARRRLPPPA